MKFTALFSLVLLLAVGAAQSQEPLTMKVITFDGKSGYVELPQNLFDNLTEGTIETWVKWDDFNKWSRVFDFGRENNAFVVQTEKDKNSVNYRIWEAKRRDHKIQAKKKLRQGVWHHVAAVFGRSGMAFYLDGGLVGTNGFEGGLNTAAGGNNYIGKSNWPKDKLFRGQMTEFRVWGRRLSLNEIARIKDRTLRGDEEGLVGYWRLGDVADGEVPSAVSGGYAGQAVGNVEIQTIPAISRFLVPGQLEVAAQVAYEDAGAIFQAGSFEEATAKFADVLDLVPGYRDSEQRRTDSQHQWDLGEAEKAYVEAEGHVESGQQARAYWAYDRVLEKVFDYKDAAAKREDALQNARYEVGLFVLASDKVRESLTPTREASGGRLSRMMSSVSRFGRKDLLKRGSALAEHQDHAYRILEDALDAKRAPYMELRRRGEMRRLIGQSGATASFAHSEQVLSGAREAGISVVVLAEFTEAYTTVEKRSSNLVVWTTKKVDYTDEDGKKKKREVEDKSYKTERHWIETEMSCTLHYRILNTATGAIIGEGALDAADGDAVDFIAWNKYDGVNPSSLRVKDGTKFKRLSSDNRSAIDARSTYKSDDEMYRAGATYLGEELAGRLLQTLTPYSPPTH